MKKRIILFLTTAFILTACESDKAASVPPDTSAEGGESELITETTENKLTSAKAVGYNYDIDNLHYELVWSDEFDYEGAPNPEKWSYDVGGNGWGNNERQYYTVGENVIVDGEKMVIEARKEDFGGSEYTSTRIITKNKGDWLYGKFEISAKLPAGKGTWPAIWMLPTDKEYGSWPQSGEIDIMEHVGYDMNKIHTTVHTKAYNHTAGTQKGKGVKIENVSTEFHKYGMEWLPDKILFYIDDVLVNQFVPTDYKDENSYKEWPFDGRFHLLINIALGGDWGGANGFDESIYPVTMEIDYVRVYQAPEITEISR